MEKCAVKDPCREAGGIVGIGKLLISTVLTVACATLPITYAKASGAMVQQEDGCIIHIDFYSARFAAYQPVSSGSKEFCQTLPNTGKTIFVLDYLHQSMKEVPVDFRIIRDVTGQGSFVRLKHVMEIEDIERHTVFYQAATIEADASLQIEYDFKDPGSYIGIVSAGHPSNNSIYTAVFPLQVDPLGFDYLYIALAAALLAVVGYFLRRKFMHDKQTVITQGV